MKQLIKGLYNRKRLFNKINNLDIKSSGVDDEGDPFIQLVNGTIFFGGPNKSNTDSVLYKSLSRKTKSALKFECVQCATDIVIRYVEAALKYGGPKKERNYSVKHGDFVSEMGAYQGFCSIKLAQKTGPSGKVVAIEPMPDNFRLLKKNKEANGLDHITIVNKGVWDSQKNLVFNRKVGDGQSSSIEMTYSAGEKIEVPADTLDNIYSSVGLDHLDYIIIQLNGAEINGLRGLNNFNPHNMSIAARYDTENVDAALAIKDLLNTRGYTSEIVEEDFVFSRLNKV